MSCCFGNNRIVKWFQLCNLYPDSRLLEEKKIRITWNQDGENSLKLEYNKYNKIMMIID